MALGVPGHTHLDARHRHIDGYVFRKEEMVLITNDETSLCCGYILLDMNGVRTVYPIRKSSGMDDLRNSGRTIER
jgi:hypothetical protein